MPQDRSSLLESQYSDEKRARSRSRPSPAAPNEKRDSIVTESYHLNADSEVLTQLLDLAYAIYCKKRLFIFVANNHPALVRRLGDDCTVHANQQQCEGDDKRHDQLISW